MRLIRGLAWSQINRSSAAWDSGSLGAFRKVSNWGSILLDDSTVALNAFSKVERSPIIAQPPSATNFCATVGAAFGGRPGLDLIGRRPSRYCVNRQVGISILTLFSLAWRFPVSQPYLLRRAVVFNRFFVSQ